MTSPVRGTGAYFDLDETLLFSRDLDPDGRWRDRVATALHDLAGSATVVPVSTRNPGQFERLMPERFFDSGLAVLSNGAVIEVGGSVDEGWARRMTDVVESSSAPAAEVQALARAVGLSLEPTLLDGDPFALSLMLADAAEARLGCATLARATEGTNWIARRSGRKLYLHPSAISKAAAVEELATRLSLPVVVSAGDSLFDLELLYMAERAIVPRGSELDSAGLVGFGWAVTPSTGPASSVEVVELATRFVQRAAVPARARE